MRIHAPTGTHDSPTSIRDPYPLIRDAANGTVELELLKQLRAGSSDSGLAWLGPLRLARDGCSVSTMSYMAREAASQIPISPA